MQRPPVRCLKLADLLNVAVNTLRFLPGKTVQAACDDVFRRLVERLGDRVVDLVRPVAGEGLVGPAPQKHVELTGNGLANGLVQAIVHAGRGPASVAEPFLGSSSAGRKTPSSEVCAMTFLMDSLQFLGLVPQGQPPLKADQPTQRSRANMISSLRSAAADPRIRSRRLLHRAGLEIAPAV